MWRQMKEWAMKYFLIAFLALTTPLVIGFVRTCMRQCQPIFPEWSLYAFPALAVGSLLRGAVTERRRA